MNIRQIPIIRRKAIESLLFLCISAVLSLPFFWQDAQAAPSWSFEPTSGTPEKLIWRTEPSRSYDLWESTDLKGWLRVDGFPKQAEGSLMEHAFAPHPGGSGFFRIESVDGPPEPPEGFALIPAGAFQMGDSFGEGHPRELPVHTVQVSAFYMGKYEVTKALWDEVRAWGMANGYTDLPDGGGKAADHPVHTINWYAMVKWCNARSQRNGLTPCYTVGGAVYRTGSSDAVACNWNANGYRLPTEAEWEKAARGGLSGKRYPWGDTISHGQANYYAWSADFGDQSGGADHHPAYNDGVQPYTSPVGSFAANGYGLHDMAGNVNEGCWDWYGSDYYSSSPGTDPRGPAESGWEGGRVGRGGGGWHNEAYYCRVGGRHQGSPPADAGFGLGFRLARGSIP